MPTNLKSGLCLSKLVDIGDIKDEEIEFNWVAYLPRLKNSIRELAVNRCLAALTDKEDGVDLEDQD